ncbi:MAG: hypothetical protein CM15mP49_26020 [Actinomycetota bacterium]|nr:MAG: hypothetical protein CM15mP49_26020 [Actinomycetota bacterium]
MNVGILTGGGDCPGLNAVIRAVVRKAESIMERQFLGFPRWMEESLINDLKSNLYAWKSPPWRTFSNSRITLMLEGRD